MEIMLSEQESTALHDALDSYVSDLRMEISDTDNPEYKRGLRHRRELLESVVAKLNEARERSEDRDADGRVIVRWAAVYASDYSTR